MKPAPFRDFSPGWGLIAAGWIGMLGVLYVFFDFVIDRQNPPQRPIEMQRSAGVSEWVLERNRAGHYVTPGTINGQPVTFLLDTGATLVSVPAHQGPTLGLVPGLHGTARTANGDVDIRLTMIDSLTFGPFQLRGIRASLNPGLKDDPVLLGMSALKHLEFTQRGKTLIWRPHHP